MHTLASGRSQLLALLAQLAPRRHEEAVVVLSCFVVAFLRPVFKGQSGPRVRLCQKALKP